MSYDPQNVFAKILRGEIPCRKVYEDKSALAFHDIQPEAPVHVLIVPKGEFCSYDDFVRTASPEMICGFFGAVQKVAAQLELPASGYRLITNHGKDGAQSVPHFHIHLLGGTALGKLLPH